MFTTIMIVIIMMIVSADCSEGADKLMIDSDESDNLPSQAIENSPPQSQVCPQRHSEIYSSAKFSIRLCSRIVVVHLTL